jgi:hypothetical protein
MASRVSQVVAEVLLTPASANARISQIVVEVLCDISSTIAPNGIAPPHAVGTPEIVQQGGIYPAGIAGPHAVGTPSMGQDQTITCTGIAPPHAVGTPTVSRVNDLQTITATSVAPVHVVGSNTVIGPGWAIVPRGIIPVHRVGMPALSVAGAAYDPIRVYIGGVEFDPSLGTVSYQLRVRGAGSANVELIEQSNTPTRPRPLDRILITENGRREFYGWVRSVDESYDPATNPRLYRWHLTCADITGICDRRTVNRNFTAGPARNMILSIASESLAGEGITTNNVTISGTVRTDQEFLKKSVTEAFNRIADLTGGIWWIDPYMDLHFEMPGTGPATPITVNATSGNARNLKVSRDASTYTNTSTGQSTQSIGT